MRALLVLVPCAACNSLLGLDPTTEREIDASVDAPIPPTCQPLPVFASQPMTLSPGHTDYTSDPHELVRAVARDPMNVQESPPRQDRFVDSSFNDSSLRIHESPRLAPSGDQLFVRSPGATQQTVEFLVYARGEDDWTSPAVLALDPSNVVLGSDDIISTPSAGAAERRLVLAHGPSPHAFFEMHEQGSLGWKPVDAPYSPAMFQLDDIQEPYLTPDGLAVIFVGVKQGARDVYILVRDQFRAFTLADLKTLYHPTTALDLHTPFVNADCSRLYFSTAVGIQYVTP